MDICIVIHTENEFKLKKLMDLIQSSPNKKYFNLSLHCKGFIPWNNPSIKDKITSFKRYSAFITSKKKVESIIELLLKVKTERIIILDEDCDVLPDNFWEENYHSLYFRKKDLKYINLDSHYNSLNWFIIDMISQKKKQKIEYNDNSEDNFRYNKKIKSNIFQEKIIFVDGGMGDHVMALPLIEKLSPNIHICCKYPSVFKHIKNKGFINWNDELFGGYKMFVYEYGSANNSKSIIDAFFEMYGFERENSDILIYNGQRQNNQETPLDKKIALICTSAAKINNVDSNKDWKDIRWFKLVHELRKKGYYVIQVGSIKDNQIPNVDLKFLDKGLENLAKLIDDSSLWITVDTFFHHFASSIKPDVGICLTPYYNDHAKHPKVKYIEKDCGKNYYERRWWLDLQQPERKECMDLIQVEDVLNKLDNVNKKIKIITHSCGDMNDNCTNWRIFQQYQGLTDFEFVHKINSVGKNIDEDLSSDIVLIQRPVLHCLEFIKTLRNKGVKVILDYDDPLPYVNLDEPSFLTSNQETLELYKNCDLITTTTENMKNYLSYYTHVKCEVLPNVINPKYITDTKISNKDKIILGWFGSKKHIESIELIKKPILKILKEFDNVYFHIYSDNEKIFDTVFHVKTKYFPYNPNFLEFEKVLSEIDINLAPLCENYMNLHKSNIRIILPGYKGIPSLVSNFAEYKNLGNENVLICNSEDDWYTNISNLIKNKELYNKYSKNIKEKINNEYSFEVWKNNKKELLNNLVNG